MGFFPDRSEVVLRHMLERKAEELRDKECVRFQNGERWSYAESLLVAYRAANALSRLGVQTGENVLVFLPNDQSWIRAWWGIACLGAVIVPLNTAYKGEMLRHVCQDSQARHMITIPELAGRVEGLGLDLNIIDPAFLAEGSSDAPGLEQPIEPWDVHAIIYTSGTTGPSKGVIISYFKSYSDGIVNWGEVVTRDDTMLAELPFFHVAGMSNVYVVWSVGGRAAVRSGFSGSRYLAVVKECGATLAMMLGTVPGFLASSPPQPNDADNPLRVVFSAPMVSDPDAFMARFAIEQLITTFGMTETTGIIRNRGRIENPKSCGKVAPGVEVRLVDDHDIPVPTGQVGELIVRADLPWIMSTGYYQRPEETAKAWRNGWFHTGDMFICDEAGNYFFVDRKKDAVRRRGENISTFEVEREVTAHPSVLEAACVAAPGEYGEDEVKVFVVPRNESEFDPGDLIRFLIPRMPYFMVPRFIEVVGELPKTATMRVKKFELRARGDSSAMWDREAAGIKLTRHS
jgi:crotonobetaine/carnitine-CoA ligase